MNCRGCIFFLAGQPNEASREIPFLYDESVSGDSVYNYYRDYSPDIGRYIESDPIGLTGGINTYAYVDNSPVVYGDPSGNEGLESGLSKSHLHSGRLPPQFDFSSHTASQPWRLMP